MWPDKIRLRRTATLDISDTLQLSASVIPSIASQAVTWTSSAPLVATVNSTGLVTAVDDGTATITATSVADGAKSGTCAVTVNP